MSVTGLLEVVRLLPRTYAMYRRLVARARAERPDVFVAIDFPDFNFRLARALRKLRHSGRLLHQPAAVGVASGRMKTMRRIADRVLVIFQFEEPIYQEAGVPVEWVGHPLLDVMPPPRPRETVLRELGLAPGVPVVALLPGSRRNELRAILPDLVRAAQLIRAAVPPCSSSWRARRTSATSCSTPLAELGRRSGRGGRTAARTTCWRSPTSRSSRPARSPCRRRCTSARWSSSIGCRR